MFSMTQYHTITMQMIYLIKEYFQQFVKEGDMINNSPIRLMFIYDILAVYQF